MANTTFVGACGTVTGSCTRLEWSNRQILVDCGLFQGDSELSQRNFKPFPFAPDAIDAVVLTHAHLDHVGLLPRLVAEGFSGPVYCTRSTRPLAGIVLEDSAKIQEEQARYAQRKGFSRHKEPRPLYAAKDARRARELMQGLPFGREQEIFPGLRVTFHRAGHLLGAAHAVIDGKDSAGERRRWCFSGDVGRFGAPILFDPTPPGGPIDALVLESTYGDRLHGAEDPERALRTVIERVFARGGVVVIPSFALGRTQEVLYHLAALQRDGVLGPDQVYLDSPMALAATDLYEQSDSEHDDDFQRLELQRLGPLGEDRFQASRSVEQSKALNLQAGPLVIVAASGMAEGGRVVHHLRQRLPDARHAIVFVGYQAAGTRGRALVDGAQSVAIHGQLVEVNAEVVSLSGLSAHADRDELLRWCRGFETPPRRVFLNHGEDPARKALAVAIEAMGWPRPDLPAPGHTVPW